MAKRILLFTGKGGVGKTSVAAATAVRAARRGARVLVTSTDPAHSLVDALDRALGDAPEAVLVGGDITLHAQQIDAQVRLERHWREIRDYLVALFAWGGAGTVEAEELLLLPGLDELFALIDLREQVSSGEYDLVVVDCAPTAETLRLLALPDALRWYVEHMLGPSRRMARAVRPLTRGLGATGGSLPLPDEEVFGAVERIHADLAAVHELLSDPRRTSVRLVVNAERLVVAESQRMATSLSLFGYGVDAVAVNRLLPEEVTDPYLAGHKQRQAEHLRTIHAAFDPTPVLTAPLLSEEVVGPDALGGLADALYADLDERAVLHLDAPVQVVADGNDRLLRVALPFTSRDAVDLHRRGGELHLRVGTVRRTVALPGALARFEVGRARFDEGEGVLEIRFVPAPAAVGAS
jgi:arsenite/tail-anchored protein-transporting ATPase